MAQRPEGKLPDLPAPNLEGFEEDSLSGHEESNWKRLDELSKAKHANALLIHKTIKWLIPSALFLGFIGFAAMTGVYMAHLLLPADYRWLTDDELQHIHSMIFSGFVGGAVALLAKMYLGDINKINPAAANTLSKSDKLALSYYCRDHHRLRHHWQLSSSQLHLPA